MTGEIVTPDAGASFKNGIKIPFLAHSQGGIDIAGLIFLHEPQYIAEIDSFECIVNVDALKISKSAIGANPIQAIEHAMLKLRVTFVHRYSQFTFFDNQGREMFFEYAPLKSFGGPAASEKEP